MPRQGRLFKQSEITNLGRQFDPVEAVASGAQAYQAAQGKTFRTGGLGDVQRSGVHGHAVYRAYSQGMQRKDDNPRLRASYGVMREHVGQQYDYMTKPAAEGGMGLKHEVTPHDPYPTPQAMAQDVAQGRIQTFATASTGSHEFFSNEENDKFRAVHDVFGHAAIGRGFSRHGEEAAYRSHRQMFPRQAHAALASETRGQNSYLNYSGSGEFPSQEGRLVGMPSWASRVTQRVPGQPPRTSPLSEQLSLF